MFQRLNIPVEQIPRTKFRLHLIIGCLVLVTFILAIARIADKGTPSGRVNTWGIAVCLKSGVFMAYQMLTAHMNRLKKWANTKINITLNIIDTVFWFALFVITIMGTRGSHSTSSQALGAFVIILAFVLWYVLLFHLFSFISDAQNHSPLAGFLSFICIRERRYYKRHGTLPGAAAKPETFV
ncbi:uncharacterized protein BDV14DRAFT_50981 [Aspergillus stella-maris]|uniref:uncharacterized protein n=1 Tax=Aspergillus stella-maris TaxID=1810926 RepID=UPI003CCD872A